MTTGFLETPESEKSYGYVTCRIIRRVADTPGDADPFPDILPAEGKVIFTPKQKNVTASNYSALVLNETIEAPLNSEGYAVRYKDADTTLIALVAGTYDVKFNITSGGDIPPMTVQITSNHTQETPLDLATIRPPAENASTTVQVISVDPSVVDGSVLIKSGASVYGVPQSEFIGPKGDTGATGRGVESVTDDDEDGIATVLYTDGATADLPLPHGPQGDPAPPPEIAWSGDVLTVDGVSSPPLSGPAGPAPDTSWSGTSLIVGDNPPVDLQGPASTVPGPPGAVATASDYLLVGPGRPDTPASTGGVITGREPVGCEFRSTDGAGVGAWVWRKRPSGKWEVTDGDTGWRNITSLTDSEVMTGGALFMRRIGMAVAVRLHLFSGKAGVILKHNVWPMGFRTEKLATGDFSVVCQLGGPAATTDAVLSAYAWGYTGINLGIIGTPRPTASFNGAELSLTTVQQWPTTLPGSPS